MTIQTFGTRAASAASVVRRRLAERFGRRGAAASSRPAASAAFTTDARPASGALPRLGESDQLRFTGTALIVLGAILLGVFGQFAGLSQISYVRDQQLALESFRFELANGTAPVAQVGQDGKLLDAGTPVAILEIPSIGVSDVVLEGTTSGTTTSGPGHRRDTVLPGQQGASVIYGRQTAYGGPFGSIAKLAVGDTITATTGQGIATYAVTDVRYPGDPVPAELVAGEGRLSLVTGSGLPLLPGTIVRVDAKLTSEVQPTPARVLSYAVLGQPELTMEGDPSAWPLLVLALMLTFLLLALFTLSRRYWGTWQTWIVGIPALLAVGIFTAQQVTVLLPNVL